MHLQKGLDMKNHRSCLVFDYGGVISKPQDTSRVEEMAQLLRLPTDTFLRTYYHFRDLYDSGAIDYQKYWEKIAGRHGIALNYDTVEQLLKLDILGWTVIDQEMVSYLGDLRRSVQKMAVISNITPDLLSAIRPGSSWLDLFDVLIFSCEVGVAKPDPKIFSICLDHLNLPADECLFIDDTPANVEAARTVGMQGHRYLSLEGLRHELEK